MSEKEKNNVFKGVFVIEPHKMVLAKMTKNDVAIRIFEKKELDLKYGSASRDLEVLQMTYKHENFIEFVHKMEQQDHT